MGNYTIKYDKSKCIGAGNCVAICPSVWELDDKGIAVCKKATLEESELSDNTNAAVACPTHAIEIYDDNGKKMV